MAIIVGHKNYNIKAIMVLSYMLLLLKNSQFHYICSHCCLVGQFMTLPVQQTPVHLSKKPLKHQKTVSSAPLKSTFQKDEHCKEIFSQYLFS